MLPEGYDIAEAIRAIVREEIVRVADVGYYSTEDRDIERVMRLLRDAASD